MTEVTELNQNTENTEVQEEPVPAEWFTKKSFARTETVYQMEISECGAASLAMVMGYYGVHVSPEVLRVETGVSRNGVNARNICEAAEKHGFIARGFRREVDRLLEATAMPCIIHWDFRHFVVFEGYKHGKFYINDPAQGHRKIDREEMESYFTGVVLEIIPTDNIVQTKKERTMRKFIAERLFKERRNLFIALLLGLCLILPGALTPVFSRFFFDTILVGQEITLVKYLLLAMILTALYKAYFGFIKARFTEMFKDKVGFESTDNLLQHMFRLPLSFFEQRATGDLVTRVNNDIEVSNFLTGDIVTLAVGLITSLVYFVILLIYSTHLALVGVAFSIISLIAVIISSKKTADDAQLYGIENGRFTGAAYSGILVSSSLKAAGAENEYASRVLGYNALLQNSDQRLGKTQQIMNVIPEAISAISNIVVLIAGSALILDGEFTTGMLMAFTGFLAAFSEPFGSLVNFARAIQQLRNDMGRVDDLNRYEEDEWYTRSADVEEFRDKDGHVAEKLSGEVELKDISFAYGSLDKPTVKGISFKIESGRSVALVGSSGCGKSTVAKLITSLYEPWTGEILFDGVPLTKIPNEVLEKSISMVTQNVVLFEGSIYNNITAWDNTIKQEDVKRAAQDACIHEDILLKSGGYAYELKSGGSNISGGQRQRIEIAKALAINPSILVLDEATSFLDTMTEKKIYENIKNRGCTCIIVAQRLSSIKDCDEIIFMKNGRIIERGSHEELMSQKGYYYELVSKADN